MPMDCGPMPEDGIQILWQANKFRGFKAGITNRHYECFIALHERGSREIWFSLTPKISGTDRYPLDFY